MNRRQFIRKAAAAGFSALAAPNLAAARSKRFTVALLGSGWWGMNILRAAIESGESDVVAICDVDNRQIDAAVDEIHRLTGTRPKTYKDYRELLDKERPEIAIIATPDHWHALMTVEACKAGSHVYVEKPVGHTIYEGRAMVKAARDAKRAVQVGTHRRVSPHNISGMQFLNSGRVGKIGMVRAFVHYPGGPGEKTPDGNPPLGLDWDMYCGPAPLRPYNPAIHPRGFRQFLDFANGTLGDWGIHWMDQILWWSDEKWPKRISSHGGRYIKQDSTDAPDTQAVIYEFERFTVTWEHRMYAGNEAEKHNIGCYFYGTNGTFHMGWQDGWTFYPSNKSHSIVHEDPQLHKPDDQNIKELWADLLEAIKKERPPVCDIEIGHRSTNMSLLGMLALKHGKTIEWDGEQEVIRNDKEANRLLTRKYRSPWQYPRY